MAPRGWGGIFSFSLSLFYLNFGMQKKKEGIFIQAERIERAEAQYGLKRKLQESNGERAVIRSLAQVGGLIELP